MKALITGANGFIGRHLVTFLNKKGIQVFPIPHQIFKNLSQLKSEIKKIKPDYIFHLASYGNHSYQTEVKKMFVANVENTFKLLSVSNDINYRAFINFGSSSEYGRKFNSMKETDTLEADTFYGATKACSTYLCRAFAKQYHKAIVTIRPFSVYGEGEADFRFIPKVIHYLNNGEVMTIDPKPKHDWIYINDFISGVYTVLKNIQRLSGEVVNIGTGKQHSNLEVVHTLEKISRKKLKIALGQKMRSYDTVNWVADNRGLRNIGWKQKFSLKEGLKRTYDYYTKQVS